MFKHDLGNRKKKKYNRKRGIEREGKMKTDRGWNEILSDYDEGKRDRSERKNIPRRTEENNTRCFSVNTYTER